MLDYISKTLFCFEYSKGVSPVFCLKILQKWYGFENPHSKEICVTDNGVSISNCFAFSIRAFNMNCLGVTSHY